MSSPSRLLRIEQPKLLVGEGAEERRYFTKLLSHLGIHDVQVEHYGGTGELRKWLNSLNKVPGFDRLRSLGVTRDANGDSAAAKQAVRDAVADEGFPLAGVASQSSKSEPCTSIFILPDDQSDGDLEALCLRSIEHEPAYRCVLEYLTCMQRYFREFHKNKAAVVSWLACRSDRPCRLGEAAEKALWNFHHDSFAPLSEFLKSL